MAKTVKSEALKHVPVTTIEETVDHAMAFLPSEMDLSLPENRIKIRNWMVRICGVITQGNAETFKKAAASAIEEAAALAIDPNYHQRRESGRLKKKAARALRQQVEAPKTRAQEAFERLSESGVKM